MMMIMGMEVNREHMLFPRGADVREFIKYCVACQKRSLAKFDIPHQPIENKLLNLMISDVWLIGDINDKKKN